MDSLRTRPSLVTPRARRRPARAGGSLIQSSPEDSGYDSVPPTPDKHYLTPAGPTDGHPGFFNSNRYSLSPESPVHIGHPDLYRVDADYDRQDVAGDGRLDFYPGNKYFGLEDSVRAGYPNFYDGNRSSREVVSDSDDSEDLTTSVHEDDAAGDPPRPVVKPRHSLPAAFFTDVVPKYPRCRSDVRPSRATPASLRQPDRFVPHRDQGTPFRERFLTTKRPYKLGPTERILRNDASTPDAFTFRPRRVTPTNPRVVSRSDTGVQPRTRTRTILAPLGGNGADPNTTYRAPSHGSAWAVGGLAPAGGAIDNGRGTLFQSGTSAPLFRSPFPKARGKTEEEEKHRGRLAAALEIDLASRVLETKSFKNRMAPSLLRGHLGPPKTFWNGSVWIRENFVPSKLPPLRVSCLLLSVREAKSVTESLKSQEMRSLPVAPFK